MKTRSDFVSNSSSSSFILKDAGFFEYFGITKQDIDDALTDLCGGREVLEQNHMDAVFYEKAGHGLNHERAEEINRKMISILQGAAE